MKYHALNRQPGTQQPTAQPLQTTRFHLLKLAAGEYRPKPPAVKFWR